MTRHIPNRLTGRGQGIATPTALSALPVPAAFSALPAPTALSALAAFSVLPASAAFSALPTDPGRLAGWMRPAGSATISAHARTHEERGA